MMQTERRLILCMPHMSGREMDYISKALEDNWAVPMGPDVNAFESELQGFLKTRKPVVALSSGTAAIHLALIAAGVRAGDEVICQSMTFSASANPVAYVGARPVFIDSEAETWNMDPELLRQTILSRRETTGKLPAAIICVHLYGMPARMDDICAIAREFGIPLIEDAAEAFGSEYGGRMAGTMGDYGILSFNGNKMITTSGGGALVCPDEATARRVMFFATQAREGYPYYQHEEIGYNYRLSNISACIGRAQLEIASEHIAHHREVNRIYQELFSSVAGITVHTDPGEQWKSNYWLTTILLAPEVRIKGREKAYEQTVSGAIGGAAGVTSAVTDPHTSVEPDADVEALRMALAAANIESRPLWKPMHCQPVFANAPAATNGVSVSLFHRGLCLPSGPDITRADQERIADLISAQLC